MKPRKSAFFAAVVLSALNFGAVPLARPQDRPVVFLTPQEVEAVRRRIDSEPWARRIFVKYRELADRWLANPRPIPHGLSGWYHNYFCPEHAVRLIYDPDSPHAHRCPVDGKIWRGARYDAYWVTAAHHFNLQSLFACAFSYAVTGRKKYAEAAARVLLAYARFFPTTEPHGEWAGKGRITAQSLDEAVLILTPLKAYELIYASGVLQPEQKRLIEETWFRPTAHFLLRQTSVIHNIHCWHNAAIGSIGFLLADKKLIDFAFNNPQSGFYAQVRKGVREEGFWFEGSTGYHFYTLSALENLVLAAQRNGVDLLRNAPKFKRTYEAPIELADPQLVIHATNDGGATRLTDQAHHYELACSWFPSERNFRQVLALAYRGDPDDRGSLEALLYGPETFPRTPEPVHNRSKLFPSSGFAVLRGRLGGKPAYLLLDFGEHGGGHGHPDKLNIIVSGLGRTLAPDLYKCA